MGKKAFNIRCIFSFQTDHTTGDPNGYYISLSRDTVQQPGDRGMLMSRDLPGSSTSQCISFWYYMYEPIVDNTGPNLGKLAVWIRTFDRYVVNNQVKVLEKETYHFGNQGQNQNVGSPFRNYHCSLLTRAEGFYVKSFPGII